MKKVFLIIVVMFTLYTMFSTPGDSKVFNLSEGLNQLSDVNITNKANDNLLVYNAATTRWEGAASIGASVFDSLTVNNLFTVNGASTFTPSLTVTANPNASLGDSSAVLSTLLGNGSLVLLAADTDSLLIYHNGTDAIFHTETGDFTFDANVVIGHTSATGLFNTVKSAGSNIFNTDTYSVTITDKSTLAFRKSVSNTKGTKAETANNEAIGSIQFWGVDDASVFQRGASIEVFQDGASGTGKVPTNMTLQTWSATAINTNQLKLHNEGHVTMSGDLTVDGTISANGAVIPIPNFAGLYQDGGGSLTVLLVNGFEKVTTFDTDMPEVVSNAAHATDDIIVGATGVYEVTFSAGATSAANNKTFEFFVFELDASPIGTAITSITKANPAVVTTSATHGLSGGERVKLTNVVGMTEVEDNIYTVVLLNGTQFSLDVDDGTDVDSGAYGSPGTDGLVYIATEITQVHSHRKFGVNSDQGAFGGSGLISLTASKTLELFFKGTTDATNLTIGECSFYMKRIQ